MIEKTAAYKTSDGKTHGTLDAAQRHEIRVLLTIPETGDGSALLDVIIAQASKIVDILSTTPTSRVKARKVNGGTKKRAPRTETSTLVAQ